MTLVQHFKGLLQNSIVSLTFIMCGLTAGVLMTFKSNWSWQWGPFIIVCELAYLGWSTRCFSRAHAWLRQVRCVALVQAHAAAQIIVAMTWMLIAGAVLAIATDDWGGAISPYLFRMDTGGRLLIGVGKIAIVTSIALAWGRLHLLQMAGVEFDTLITGAFTTRTVTASADPTTVEKTLLRVLERLELPGAQRLSRYLISADVCVNRRVTSGPAQFELRWNYLPCMAVITLLPTAHGVTDVRLEFLLRGGVYRAELILNTIDVHMLAQFLQTNVVRPLVSDSKLRQAISKQNELRDKALESQLRILQAQIEPHFLFNTLANARHLYRSSVDEGERMMDHLITYLRGTLEELRWDASTVGREMDLALHYLAIMKIRMGARLSYRFTLPASLAERPFPPAMLISLVENAIKHGLHDVKQGELSIEASVDGDMLCVSVTDNGVGLSSVGGAGVGLTNIRQRLEAIHGSGARLDVGAMRNGGFTARIAVPIAASCAVQAAS